MKKSFLKNKNGFTLIELLLAVALFSIVVVIAFGAITTTVDVNRKSQTLTTVMNDLNFTLENLTRTIKTAQKIYENEDNFTFKDQRVNDNYVTYIFDQEEGKIKKCESGSEATCTEFVSIVSDQIIIEDFYLEMLGEVTSATQPRFLMVVKGYAQITPKTRSEFSLQTTVSPRIVNFAQSLKGD